MKKTINWCLDFSKIIAATFVGVMIAFWVIYEAPIWINHYCETHDSAMCQMQVNDDN